MTEYNKRQLDLMSAQIAAYECAEMPLGELVRRIEALIDAIQSPDNISKQKLKSAWGELEAIYAVSLDRGLDEKDREVAESAVDALRAFKIEMKNWSHRDVRSSDGLPEL